MAEKLTKAQRRELAALPDEPKNVGGQWKASRTFLDLYGIHRTPAGRAALQPKDTQDD